MVHPLARAGRHPLSEVSAGLFDMRTAYVARTQVSNTCSTRVSTLSVASVRHRTSVLSDARSRNVTIRATLEDAMSDVVVWDFVTAPARIPSGSARPRLRLVGPDERIGPD